MPIITTGKTVKKTPKRPKTSRRMKTLIITVLTLHSGGNDDESGDTKSSRRGR